MILENLLLAFSAAGAASLTLSVELLPLPSQGTRGDVFPDRPFLLTGISPQNTWIKMVGVWWWRAGAASAELAMCPMVGAVQSPKQAHVSLPVLEKAK